MIKDGNNGYETFAVEIFENDVVIDYLFSGNKTVSAASTSRDHAYEHAYAKLQNQSDALM